MPAPAQVIVLGMHRSGTSALTHLLRRMGLWAGAEEDFNPADEHNEGGYWEHRGVWAVDEALLDALGATWSEVADFDLARLDGLHARFRERVREVVRELDGHGSWVIKDPRLCLTFPLWREVLERPVCVLLYREPLPVARSLALRDRFPIPLGIALWEKYTREALASTRGLPRVLVSHGELMADPEAILRRLHGFLARHQPELAGFTVPTTKEIHAVLDPSLVHHRRAAAEERCYLTPPQISLLESLQDGSALERDPAPLSPGARELLADHQERRAEQRRSAETLSRAAAHDAAREEALVSAHSRLQHADARAWRVLTWLDQLDDIFRATLESRSWRIGRALTSLLPGSSRIGARERRDRLMAEVWDWRERPEE
jgi:hypothetical protein